MKIDWTMRLGALVATATSALLTSSPASAMVNHCVAHNECDCQVTYSTYYDGSRTSSEICDYDTCHEVGRDCYSVDDSSGGPSGGSGSGNGGGGSSTGDGGGSSSSSSDSQDPCDKCKADCNETIAAEARVCGEDVTRIAAVLCSYGLWPDGSIRDKGSTDENKSGMECVRWGEKWGWYGGDIAVDPVYTKLGVECTYWRDKKPGEGWTTEYIPSSIECVEAWTKGMPNVGETVQMGVQIGGAIKDARVGLQVGGTFTFDPYRGLNPSICGKQTTAEALMCASDQGTCSYLCGQ